MTGKSKIDPHRLQQAIRLTSQTSAQLLATAWRLAGDHILLMAVLFVVYLFALLLVGYLFGAGLFSGYNYFTPVLAALYTLVSLLFWSYFNPGRQVNEWAIAESERQEIASLSGKNPDELQRMLNWQLKQGNIAEADRISQQLLSMVEQSAETGSAGSTGADASARQPPPAGIGPATPSAVARQSSSQNQALASAPEQKPDSVLEPEEIQLPDWIKP